jgi:hypothetical protein
MQFDIRIPIGIMFLLIGGVLSAYGWVAAPSGASGSLALNVDVWWGGAMALFGIGMLALARRAMVRKALCTPEVQG